jgi:hypothetical protein
MYLKPDFLDLKWLIACSDIYRVDEILARTFNMVSLAP